MYQRGKPRPLPLSCDVSDGGKKKKDKADDDSDPNIWVVYVRNTNLDDGAIFDNSKKIDITKDSSVTFRISVIPPAA